MTRKWTLLAVVALFGLLAVLVEGPCPTCLYAAESEPAPAAVANPVVIIETSMGTIQAELFADKAPKSVENFLKYVDDGFYDGTIFHRVIGDFMIQGGGLTPDMKEKKTRAPIKNEAGNGLKNLRGTLAMARKPDVDSATSQFFINVVDNGFLNHRGEEEKDFGYAVFGKVISGMDVVDKIKVVPTTSFQLYTDVPVTPVVIKSIKRAPTAQ